MRPVRPGRRARFSVPLLIVTMLLGVGAGAAAYYLLGAVSPKPGAGDGQVAQGREGEITALGRLEPADGVLDILGPPGDRVLALGDVTDKGEPVGEPLPEGAEVKKDATVLAVLESWKDRKQDLLFAQSQRDEAVKRRQAIAKSGDEQIHVAGLAVEQAKQARQTEPQVLQGNLDLLEQSRALAEQQYQALKASNSLANFQVEERRLQAQKLATELKNARAQMPITLKALDAKVATAEANLALARAERERGMAEVPVESAESRLALAKMAFERTKIKAPRDGKILKVFAQPGEVLTNRPIMTLADTGRMVAVTEVYETDVKALRERLAAGKAVPAKVVSPALPGGFDRANPRESAGALKGHVVSVGSQIARNRVYDINPSADVDRRVVEVRVLLDDAGRAAGFINLQVTVYLDLK